jgi:hypothetical protein
MKTMMTSALVLAALAGPAAAQGVTGSVQYLGQEYAGSQGGVGFNNGGIFEFELNGGLQGFGNSAGGNELRTFCIEIGEFVGSGAAQINTNPDGTRSIMGGETNPDQSVTGANADKVEFETAYLFTQFNLGTSGDFADDFTSFASQRAMQLAIWYFEESLGTYDDVNDTYSQSRFATNSAINAKAAEWITAAIDAGWQDVGKVRALNIGGGPNWGKQDMLIMIPLPQGAALAGAGLAVVGIRRRRDTLG